MKKAIFLFTLFAAAFISGCQKGIDWDIRNIDTTGTGGDTTGTGGGDDGGGSGGDTLKDGELLTRVVSINQSTLDSSVVNIEWDANKRPSKYVSSTQGYLYTYRIERYDDGKVSRILTSTYYEGSKSDSAAFYPYYQAGTGKLDYVIDTFFSSLFGNLIDSAFFVYNSSGQIVTRGMYTQIFGLLTDQGKRTYEYDATGNMTKLTYAAATGGGTYLPSYSNEFTYNSHKSSITFGDECFILGPLLNEANISVNDLSFISTINEISATTTSYTITDKLYNSLDRPVSCTYIGSPSPDVPIVKSTFYYK